MASMDRIFKNNCVILRNQKLQDSKPILRTPPISLDWIGPPNFRPIVKMGPPAPVGAPPCASPMEISYEQIQSSFNRRTPSSRQGTPQDQLCAGLAQAACTLSSFGRVHRASGSSEYSDTDVKVCVDCENSMFVMHSILGLYLK